MAEDMAGMESKLADGEKNENLNGKYRNGMCCLYGINTEVNVAEGEKWLIAGS